MLVMGTGVTELRAQPVDLRALGGAVRGAAAGRKLPGFEKVFQHDQACVVHRRREGNAVVAFWGDGECGVECSGAKLVSGLREEQVVRGLAIVVASTVVVAQRRIQRNVGKRLPELPENEGDGLGRKRREVLCAGPGREPLEAAGEVVREQVAGKRDKQRTRFGVTGRRQRRFQKRPGAVQCAGAAVRLQRLQIGRLGRRRGAVQDRGPAFHRFGAQLGDLGRVAERIEVDVGQHDHGKRGLCHAQCPPKREEGRDTATDGLEEAHTLCPCKMQAFTFGRFRGSG